MDIRIVDDYNELSKKAAEIVAEQVRKKNDSVLGLATGSTPEGMYACLVNMYSKNEIDFSTVVTFNLDEYIGLPPDHPQSYNYYMHNNFFNHVNVKKSNIYIPHCENHDSNLISREYEQKIKKTGGIDLQILGIGTNGHIGFNEPHKYLRAETHSVKLTEETIKANSRFFSSREEVPGQAITMGVGSIMNAAKIMLMANGESKAVAIRDMCSGIITTKVPASLLQLHRDVIVLVDREAASLLKKQ